MRYWIRIDRPEWSQAALEAMRSQSLSQAEVARRLGVTRQYFGRVLKGQVVVSLEVVKRIEAVLEVSFEVNDGQEES